MLFAKPMSLTKIFCLTTYALCLGYWSGFAQKISYSKVYLEKMAYANEVLKKALAKNDSLQIAEAYYLFGKAELSAGNHLVSHEWFMKALRIQEAFGDSYELGRLYIRLRDKEQSLGNYDGAVRYLRMALGVFKRAGSDMGLMRAYSGLGDLYADVGLQNKNSQSVVKFNSDSALYYQKKAEALSVKLKDTIALANIHISLGKLFTLKKDPKAINYFQKALDALARLKKENETMAAMLHLASAYIAFNQPQNAYHLLLEAQQYYERKHMNSYAWRRNLEAIYVDYYEALHNWQQAFAHLKILADLEKKLLEADQKGAVTRLEIEYDTQKKEAVVKKQQEELQLRLENIRTQRMFMLMLVCLLILTISLSFFYYRLYRKNRQISQRNAILVKEQNHRVKNNLQLVSSLLSLQANQLTDPAALEAIDNSRLRIESMAILHRKLYDGKQLAMVNLPDFIKEIVDVILRTFGCDHLEPDYNLTAARLTADQALPLGLIINELITNACKYAFPNSINPKVDIGCFMEKDELLLKVKDNGPGFQNLVMKDTFGMRLIQMQVNQLSGSYSLEPLPTGTQFIMKFKPDLLP